jgi:hypothetical protein
LWKLLRQYGVPLKIISFIHFTYQEMSCRIVHANQLLDSFEVKTGVYQGCLLSPFLFLLVIDWIMKTKTTDRNNNIQWRLYIWMTSTLQLTWHSSHITTTRCRTRPLAWKQHAAEAEGQS